MKNRWYKIAYAIYLELEDVIGYGPYTIEDGVAEGVMCIKAHGPQKAIKHASSALSSRYNGRGFYIESVEAFPPNFKMDAKKLSEIEKPVRILIGSA